MLFGLLGLGPFSSRTPIHSLQNLQLLFATMLLKGAPETPLDPRSQGITWAAWGMPLVSQDWAGTLQRLLAIPGLEGSLGFLLAPQGP